MDERLLPVAVVLCGLGLWEAVVRMGWASQLFFPPPSSILQTLCRMALAGKLWPALGITLFRLGVGVLLGAGAGVLLGWLMGSSRLIRTALNPVVATLHPLPKLALFPIFLMLLGIGESSKVALVTLAAFFPMVINTLAGVQQIDRNYWDAATIYGANRTALLRWVVLPGSLPMVMVGLRLAVNNALVVTIAAEMLSAREGLGTTIWMAWQTLRTEELYATLIVIGLLGLLTHSILERLTHRLIPWRVREDNNG